MLTYLRVILNILLIKLKTVFNTFLIFFNKRMVVLHRSLIFKQGTDAAQPFQRFKTDNPKLLIKPK